MSSFFKSFIFIIIALAVIWIAIVAAFRIYDDRTRGELSALVVRELSPNADTAEMISFMERHTESYDLDDKIQFRYAGLRKQSKLDKILYRKVGIILFFNPENRTYSHFSISIYYTWL